MKKPAVEGGHTIIVVSEINKQQYLFKRVGTFYVPMFLCTSLQDICGSVHFNNLNILHGISEIGETLADRFTPG
ncbi:hypothetical protein NQ317_005192 [Molorchus minor]|uniref:Uncharacterized protein n=1 Tax=Molorchus minor TaxID=1323400 RepID=A0ABQ9J199_9CUCU|nr:hypothetical protein NQ317_005192 [Molorchus minor]